MNGTVVTEEAGLSALATGLPVGGPHLGLLARDPYSVADWWCRTLGFVPAEWAVRDDDTVPSEVLVRHPDSGLVVGFTAGTAGSQPGQVSLRVASREALEDWACHLDELEVSRTEVRDNGLELFLSLIGPDGIGLELWWPRPR